jgi:tetratricopeptide (TPR) repeat protein
MDSGMAFQAQGQYADAKAQFESALRETASFGHGDARTYATRVALGMVAVSVGRYKEAEESDNEAVRLGMDIYGKDSQELAIPFHNLAVVYAEQHEFAPAEEYCHRALSLLSGPASAPAAVANVLGSLGGIQFRRGRLEEAEASLLESIRIAKTLPPGSEILAGDLSNLSTVYVQQGRRTQALAALRQAYDLYYQAGGWNHPNLFYVLTGMASIEAGSGRLADAVTHAESAVQIAESGGSANTIAVRDALTVEAAWLHKLKRDAEAKRVRAKAMRVAAATAGNSYTQYTVDARRASAASTTSVSPSHSPTE